MKKKLFSAAKLVFFLGIGVLFIWLFVKDLGQEEKRQIMESFSKAGYGWIILALLVSLLSHIVRTLRWQMLLKPIGYKAGFWNVFMALMIGYFANLALPRLGEVTRCTILTKYEKIPFQKSFGTVVAERAFDFITFLVLFFINLLFQWKYIHLYVTQRVYNPLAEKFTFIGKGYVLYGVIAAFIVLGILLFLLRKKLQRFGFYQKVVNIIRGFFDGLKSLVKVKRPFLFLFYTGLMWLLYFLMTYLCFFSISEVSGAGPMVGFSVLILGTIGIMVVQGGVGIYPVIVAETIVLYMGKQIVNYAYALGWLIWTAQTVALVLCGIISLILLPLLNKSHNGKNINSEAEVTQS